MGNFFVRRPIVAMVIAIVMVIVGVISLVSLPMEQYPNITPPIVEVQGTYIGANAVSVEQSVATPVEQEVNGVENMIYMKSTNSNDGIMKLQISFEVGSDPDMATVFTQNRVSAATAKLPEDVKRYGVTTKKTLPNIILLVTLTSDGRYDQDFLGNYALINIKDILARIKGIGNVSVLGTSDYSMRIWVRPDRLAQLGVSITEIRNAINQQSVIVPGGKFGAEPAPPGTEFTYTVRLPERLATEEQFREIIIRTNPDGSQVRVKDVARVELGVERYQAYTRLNGQSCALIALYQMPGSNAVELGEQIVATMDRLEEDFPEGVSYEVSLDATKPITAGIEEIVVTLFVALALVILVVFIFIQDWRATLIPTIAIPVSLVGALMLFPALGFTVNTLSLLGLVLAIGIVVDDAIVVVEAVQVKIQEGLSPRDATIAAMKEVTAPVIATTLVLVAVFIPVASMGGITGRLYQQFAITIAVSVVFSSINALTLSPALSSLLLRKQKPIKGPLGKFFKGFNRVFDKSSVGYLSFTQVVTRKIKRSVVFIIILVAGIVVIARFVPGGFIPEEDMSYFYVNIQLPDASSIQRADEISRQVEEILAGHEGMIEYVTTISGYSMLSGAMIPNTGFIFVSTRDWGERDENVTSFVYELNREFHQKIKAAQVFAFGPPAIPGLGSGSGFSLMLQDRSGNTPEYLAGQTRAFVAEASKRPEIGSIFTTYRASVPQKYLQVNKDLALKAGVDLNEIYSTVGAFLGGTYVNDFNRFGRLYKTYIQSEPEYRVSREGLNLFFVRNRNGDNVPLSSLVTVEDATGPDYTIRYNLYRAAELTGQPAEGYTSAQAMDALEEVARSTLPQGMGYEWSNMSYQEKMAGGSGNIVFVFALLFVFLILAAQYESWSLPFSILLGTPFAVFGAMLFIFLFRLFSESYENNVFMQISLVMLIAMAAKNAILIVEFANMEFEKGKNLFDAAITAARIRFRPILMTAFSFILGVLPLVFASGAGAEARKVMGVALLGGMSIATFLGVFMYPMLFVLIGKLAGYEKKRVRLQAQTIDTNSKKEKE
jgi:HAE1 family hydrophobic/amphiphilic exporter-1